MKVFVLLMLAVLCAGCASRNAWFREQTSIEQALNDLADCRYNVGKNSSGSGSQQASISAEKVNDCMKSRGYYLVNRAAFEKDNNIK
jgi:hypothetical protein